MTGKRRFLFVLVALLVPTALLVACSGGDSATPAGTPKPLPPLSAIPAGLPEDLGLGLMNGPQQLDWMTSSGIRWDYRYQYLTGGVNTDGGWATWGTPGGSFLGDYLQQSLQNKYIPVLTYYQIVPSQPNPTSEDVLPKLRNASTMNAYYADWESLMRQLGAYGKTAIVHVEPDLWGYMERANGDATKVKVDVQSSGAASVAGFDDSAAGFAQALVHLRDLYAPNVVLGFHVSDWATGKDLILNKANPVATAAKIGAFYRSLGAQFDLLFVDASDRDAAWYQAQRGDGGAHWWKDADFERFGTFVNSIVRETGRWAVVWQVPIGNTVYRSMDNSWGHYQDNRVQYWLGDPSHAQALADDGVIAVLFGAGADGCTTYTDAMNDGITNPSPINGNDQEAQYADDDGGYLRSSASAYYQAGAISLPTP